MKELITSIEVNAPANIVWQVLTDFNRYPEWNPFIRSIVGVAEQDAKLEVYIQPPGGNGMTFRPIVLAAETEREFRWLGHLIVPGLFDGEHRFIIELLSENRVRFVHSEKFTGLLVPILWRSLNTQTRQGFEEMNRAISVRAEKLWEKFKM